MKKKVFKWILWPAVGLIHFGLQSWMWIFQLFGRFPRGSFRLALLGSWWPEILGFPFMTLSFRQYFGFTSKWFDPLADFSLNLTFAVLLFIMAVNSFIWVITMRMISRWILNLKRRTTAGPTGSMVFSDSRGSSEKP